MFLIMETVTQRCQPTRSPEATFIVISNAKLNVVHFTLPMASGDTKVLDLSLTGPGLPMWYAKDPSIQYGIEANASNYVAMIPVPDGLAFIDMLAIVDAFANGVTYLPSSTASIVSYTNGGAARTMANGGDYAIGASYSSASTINGIAIINVRTRSVKYIPNLVRGASKFLWVPIFGDEVINQVERLASVLDLNKNVSVTAIAGLQLAIDSLNNKIEILGAHEHPHEESAHNDARNGIIIGSIAICFSVISMVVALVLLFKPPHQSMVQLSSV
jgi:hypothetical protein